MFIKKGKNANAELAQLQGRDMTVTYDPNNPARVDYRPTTEQEKSDMSIHYQDHKSDLVGTIIGGKASWEPVYKPKISKSINSNDKKGE